MHEKVRLDTDYEFVSEAVDIIDKGEGTGTIIVFKTSGFLLN